MITSGKPPAPLECSRVTLHYYFGDNRRRDPDNYCGKFLLDGLRGAGVLRDDDFRSVRLVLEASFGAENPGTVITVEPLPDNENGSGQ